MVLNNDADTFSRFTKVSRETILNLKIYNQKLLESNKYFNLIGKSTEKLIWVRHFLDSAQVIDLIDKNCKYIADLGTGAGFPGIVLAIMGKDRKMDFKTKLYEKSAKKKKFLEDLCNELNLNIEIRQNNLLDDKIILNEDIIIARAFKPIQTIFDLIHKKGKNWKKIIIFQGKSGKNEIIRASKNWDIEYKQRVSITSSDSTILEIKKIKKK